MNRYDSPPIVLATDTRTVFENADPARFAEAKIETRPARFLIFRGERKWVLRSYYFGKDYPFVTPEGAKAGMLRLTESTADPYFGSFIELNAYGAPDVNVEVFA
ncbi:hypothetical protein SEA_LAHQTEMISH_52 [Microbacterium phage Lahqtemish]|uniref:hypothetical protein n=1 Tax=Microbacterium phage Lahqtemish TaxID=2776867 RepID=UPI0018A497CB|nr:hypothetical protein QDW25_gp52 [Microbacterium phage Lahqtemish]QOP66643.1 hypothetical protein SEA_LAHQTEMISH_52 [Microbacterium phage Lahqtemish]